MSGTVLTTLPSGTIDLVRVGDRVHIQFNASCADALPYCHAACCRSRPEFNVHLTPAEARRFSGVVRKAPHYQVDSLAWEDGHCVYLSPGNQCRVHDLKPQACRKFHCSPGGGTGTETVRGTGFALTCVLPEATP